MKVCELIEYLKRLNQEADIDISVDVSTDDENVGDRAFAEHFLNDHVESGNQITLLFAGNRNFGY